jgi:hypothetical protein
LGVQIICWDDSGQPFAGDAAVVVSAAFRHVGSMLNCVPVSWVRALVY